jgi:acetyl esterase/lipase
MPQAIPLWSSNVPYANGTAEHDIPTLTPFIASNPTGAAIVICPGGGYQHLAPHEADPIAEWLNTHGISGFVLRYRLAPHYRHPVMLTDVTRAMRIVRSRASEFSVDPGRIGVLGFSAGGHLAASVSTHYDAGDPSAADPIDRVSSRPDLSILLYAVISMLEGMTHGGSRKNLLGENPSRELSELMSNELQVNANTPPAFLFHTVDDGGVPVENSIAYASALRRAGVPFEMHLFEKGRHGVGLAKDDPVLRAWPHLCAAWLAARGWGRTPS